MSESPSPRVRSASPKSLADIRREWLSLLFGFLVIGAVGVVLRVNLTSFLEGPKAEYWGMWVLGSTMSAALGVLGVLYVLLQLFLDVGGVRLGREKDMPPAPPIIGGAGVSQLSALETAGSVALASNLIERLEEEVRAQGQRANANLGLGMVSAAIGLGFLGWLAYATASGGAAVSATRLGTASLPLVEMLYWGSFLAKVTLSITTNVIAFFFLSTYRRNLSEVRYFQNELTNVQLQVAALLNAATHGFNDTQQKILMTLAATERNFVLKKGETTADLTVKSLDKDEILAFVHATIEAMNVSRGHGGGERGAHRAAAGD